jgi:hypothetical protein
MNQQVPYAGYLFADRFFGNFFPARRASDSPMAMACCRLVTLFPELPLRKVPALRSLIALATFSEPPLLYCRAMSLSELQEAWIMSASTAPVSRPGPYLGVSSTRRAALAA